MNRNAAKIRLLVIFIMMVAVPPCARAGGESPAPALSLSDKTANLTEIAPAALGAWHYDLLSGDVSVGSMDISVTAEDRPAGPCYRFEQTGEFIFSATETRRIRTAARLNPDLSLIDYQRDIEISIEGRVAHTETMTAESGALSVTMTRPDNKGNPAETMIKKNGPVYLASAAAWLFMLIMPMEPSAVYRFDNFLAEPGEILSGTIEINGMVSRKQGGDVEQVLRVTASNGRDFMQFHIDGKGRIVDFGPATGEIVFTLKEEE